MLKFLKDNLDAFGDLLFPGSFLITWVAWMVSFWPSVHGSGDLLACGVVATIAAACTFWLTAFALLIPVSCLIAVISRLFRRG